MSFRCHLRIEQFRLRVSSHLASHIPEPWRNTSTRERLATYRLLNACLDDLVRDEKEDNGVCLTRIPGLSEVNTNHFCTAFAAWHLAAARLHLHAFYFFDEAESKDYQDRIVTLYHTAFTLVELSLEYEARDTSFFEYCPFFCYQVFVCAAFAILRILMNGFFRLILDVESGMKILETAITALRKISVVNNDLPARLGDVISFFCAMPDPTVVGGVTIDDLRLRQVRSRLSTSVVYDCLWTWRRHFQREENEGAGGNPYGAEDEWNYTLNPLCY